MSTEFKYHTITTRYLVPFRFCELCVNFEATPITEEEWEGRCTHEFICKTTASLLLNSLPIEVDVDGIPLIYSLKVELKEPPKQG